MGALCAPQETKTQLISFSYIYAHTSFLLLTRKNNNKKTWKTSRAMKTVQAEISSLLRNHFQLWHPLGIFLQVTFSSRTTVKRKTVLWTQSLKIVTFWHFGIFVRTRRVESFHKVFVFSVAAGCCAVCLASAAEGQRRCLRWGVRGDVGVPHAHAGTWIHADLQADCAYFYNLTKTDLLFPSFHFCVCFCWA